MSARPLVAGFERDAAVVFVGTSLANVSAYGFHFIMSRHLGPSGYGALAAILGIGVVVAIPTAALQFVVAREVARQPEGPARAFAADVFAIGVGAGVVVAVAMVVTLPLWRSYLHLGWGPMLWAGLWFVALGATPALLGYLQGRRRFGALTLSLIVAGGGRLALGAVTVLVGVRTGGAVAAVALAAVGGFFVAAIACWPLPRARRLPRATLLEVGRTVVPLLGLSLLAGMDVIFARHYLSAQDAGYYAAASVGGKLVLWAPAAVNVAAFPAFAEQPESRRLLARAVGLVALICAVVSTVTLLFKHLLIGGIFGDRFNPASNVVLIVALAMSALTILQVVTMWAVARRAHLAGAVVLFGAVATGGLLMTFHANPRAIAVDMVIALPVVLVATWIVTNRSRSTSGVTVP